MGSVCPFAILKHSGANSSQFRATPFAHSLYYAIYLLCTEHYVPYDLQSQPALHIIVFLAIHQNLSALCMMQFLTKNSIKNIGSKTLFSHISIQVAINDLVHGRLPPLRMFILFLQNWMHGQNIILRSHNV